MTKRYAIIDIETTGGLVKRDKITEIAIVLHDGKEIINKYETLINPERSIPEFITNMTGISNEMVSQAPKFFEVAKDIVELTEGAVFVAHNARFDYSFIRQEFQRLGYTYSRKQLCTVRLSRKVYPELKRYGLERLTKHFGIKVENRHRAMDDALATVELFNLLLSRQYSAESMNEIVNLGIKEARLPANISLDYLHSLPEDTGVYYFLDRYGQIIYIGKSKNIRKRVMQHFARITEKAAKMQQRVHEINYTLTGSELIALLFENQEIKKHQPEINRAQRRNAYPFVVYSYLDEDGYLCLSVEKRNKIKNKGITILNEYPRSLHATSHLKLLTNEFMLCQNKTGEATGAGPCFHHQIDKCYGACAGYEPAENYNIRAQAAIDHVMKSLRENILIIDKGRNDQEKSIIGVVDGSFYGFGYIDQEISLDNAHQAFDHIKPCIKTPESSKIIHWYLKGKKVEKVIRF
jgi:DNA polymerase-3 subunit epsilon